MALRRLALVLEYQGTHYSGFQLQENASTVQGEIERALHKLTGECIRVRGASRTDAGAHAKGQVVDFLTNAPFTTETFLRGANFYLPPDIKVRGSYEVNADFHSRKDAVSRVYRFNLLNSESPSPLLRELAHWVWAPLDVGAMEEAAGYLVGTHDLSALSGPLARGSDAVRRVDRWEVWTKEEMVVIEAEANGFLPHQVRRTNSVLVEIGLGKLAPGVMGDIVGGNASVPDRCPYLPAKGLCLMAVKYEGFPPEGSQV